MARAAAAPRRAEWRAQLRIRALLPALLTRTPQAAFPVTPARQLPAALPARRLRRARALRRARRALRVRPALRVRAARAARARTAALHRAALHLTALPLLHRA